MRLESIPRDLARGGYLVALTMAGSVFRSNPVPFPLLRFGQSLAPYENPLTPRYGVPLLDPAKIEDPDLARVFEGQAFSEWSINHDAVNFLQRLHDTLQPDSVLEFGSGVSTAVFTYLMRQRFGTGAKRVVSVEQSLEFAGSTHELLDRSNLRNAAQFEYPGMVEREFDGELVSSYDLSDDLLRRIFGAIQPTLIFIDGPYGTGPVRGPVLPRILPYLRAPATVVLDDALRDNEMRILRAWSQLPGVEVKGVHLIRKGMAEIVVTPRN